MPGILTITFNPAIDKSTSVEALVPDKKMKCKPPVFEPGGGGVNVSRAIKRLGGNAETIYLAGGYSGKFFTELLKQEGINGSVVEISSHTRENLIVVDESSNSQYRFGMPGPTIQQQEWESLLEMVRQNEQASFIIASGSLSPGIPIDIFARIAGIAREKKAKYIVDTSGEALKLAVEAGVFLVKPNLGELSFLAGKKWLEKEDTEQIASELIQSGKSKIVVVSMGAKGALIVSEKEKFMISPPKVEKKSTVGAGDSMVAGLVLKLFQGRTLKEAANYGVASGTAATMNSGTELCRLEDVEKIYKKLITDN